ncbi:hypothetical protein J43TS9_51380 [Paenibacillus cineris]|nr:hypothetical protein J43TS9_51380 [Paenibacillus cineris]
MGGYGYVTPGSTMARKSNGELVNLADSYDKGGMLVNFNGSPSYDSFPDIVVTTTETVLQFSQVMKSVMITNDGTGDVKIAFQGKSPVTAVHDNLDAAWTYTGTWLSNTSAAIHKYGPDATYGSTSGAAATYNPNLMTNRITWHTSNGGAAGIADIRLSSDGGATWKKPSEISGLSRSDGATGTAMDSADLYGTNGTKSYGFTLPFYAKWMIRILYTGTKSSGATNAWIWVDAGAVGVSPIIVKPLEAQTFPIVTSDMRLICDSGTQPVRVVAIP